jgi:ABC-type dipeptide/oligopeptide/nickel transport system permease subunit
LDDPPPYHSGRKQIIRATLTNFPFILGILTVIGLAVLAIWGTQLTSVNPYTNRNVMMIQGKVYGPPFNPSTTFPWGSDLLGRDIQALVLAGARQTLVLAFLAVIARLMMGTILGLAIGWWQNSWFDRLILGLMAVWSAFPVTIFAAILILGLGIQRGIGVFILALCIVGWGEITQYIRSKVIAQKPSLYIEAARSVGARSPRILFRHILPNLLPDILVLGALEMSGVLMLLAELGFLNIFLGGGFRVEMLEGTIYNYSDVPEWGALLANIRNLWRSYPWVAWSPGLAFFVSILGFNLLGEGLRRLLKESRITIGRLFNRATLLALVALIFGLNWMVQTSAPVALYQPQARTFDANQAGNDIAMLASPGMQGRESGTPGSKNAAEYIASRMAEIGLSPAGSGDTFIQQFANTNYHLTAVPLFKILDSQGNHSESLVYRQDFVEDPLEPIPGFGQGKGQIVGLAVGSGPAEFKQNINSVNMREKIIIINAGDSQRLPRLSVAGMLVISDDPMFLNRRYLSPFSDSPAFPVLMITPELGDRLLKTAGSSLAEFDSLRHDLDPNQVAQTNPGVTVSIWFPNEPINLKETCQNVIGYIPGTGAEMGVRQGAGLDNQVILLSAYYDSLGIGPDGTLYPGANDNASSVATLLEVAHVIKNGPYQPKKTIVFAAWCGGERQKGFSVVNIMNAKITFNQLEVEAVLELTGLAQGEGKGIALGSGTSYRLNQLIVKAASQLGISVTTRGRDTHMDIPRSSGFGGRKALSAYLSWDGSDILAHTAEDRMESVDLKKLQKSGELVTLITTVLSRETTY